MKVDLSGMLGVWMRDLEDELWKPGGALCRHAKSVNSPNLRKASEFM
jgi:hypothetical protein